MNRLDLKGIDGTSPLGFLAAMGAFRVAFIKDAQARMAWETDIAAPYPILHSDLTAERFAETVCVEARRVASEIASYNPIIKVPAKEFRFLAQRHIPETGLPATPSDSDYFAAFASDGVLDKKGAVEPSLLSFSNGGAGQHLLKDYGSLTSHCDVDEVFDAIIKAKPQIKPITNLNWEPSALRHYGLRWKNPEHEDKQTNAPLHILAFMGLTPFTAMPLPNRISTVGFDRNGKFWTWILWSNRISYSVAMGLLRSHVDMSFPGTFRLKSQRFSSNKRFYFTPATPL